MGAEDKIVKYGCAVLDVGIEGIFGFFGLGAGFDGAGLMFGLDVVV
jgi:hypothetical protein